jgi:hypothetical protein
MLQRSITLPPANSTWFALADLVPITSLDSNKPILGDHAALSQFSIDEDPVQVYNGLIRKIKAIHEHSANTTSAGPLTVIIVLWGSNKGKDFRIGESDYRMCLSAIELDLFLGPLLKAADTKIFIIANHLQSSSWKSKNVKWVLLRPDTHLQGNASNNVIQ